MFSSFFRSRISLALALASLSSASLALLLSCLAFSLSLSSCLVLSSLPGSTPQIIGVAAVEPSRADLQLQTARLPVVHEIACRNLLFKARLE